MIFLYKSLIKKCIFANINVKGYNIKHYRIN